jgi:hypothetical protein
MLSQFLCFIGCHDWRNMDGYCRECGETDGVWMRDMHPNLAAPTGVEPVSSDSKSGASPLGHGAIDGPATGT